MCYLPSILLLLNMLDNSDYNLLIQINFASITYYYLLSSSITVGFITVINLQTCIQKIKSVPLNCLQSHLNHNCWRIYCKDCPDLFLPFLEDI